MVVSADSVIDVLYSEHLELRDYLEKQKEITLRRIIETNYPKVLALSAGGYFEQRVTSIIMQHVKSEANDDIVVVSFVENKAIKRQYHTYFQWDGNNANAFFGLFGEDFRRLMAEHIRSDQDLDESIRAFLRLGNLRNEIAHSDFGTYLITYTTDEVYEMYQKASKFIEVLADTFRQFGQKQVSNEAQS
jgi:hypothetical protein